MAGHVRRNELPRLLKTKQEIHVGISEYKIAQYPDKLMTVDWDPALARSFMMKKQNWRTEPYYAAR